MRRYFLGLLAVVLPLALAQTLPAEDEAQRGGPSGLFDRLDADGDGQVTKDEVPEGRERFFNRLLRSEDKNDDGKLSRDEFETGIKSRRPRRSLDEKQPPERPRGRNIRGPEGRNFRGPEGRDFRGPDRRDIRGSGGPDRRGPAGPGRRGPGGRGGRGGRGFGGSAMGPPPGPGMNLMRVLDTDHNGSLSKEEIATASSALAKLDKNDDGKVSRNELMPSGRHGRRGQHPQGQHRPRQARLEQDRPRRDRLEQDRPRRGPPRQGRQGQGRQGQGRQGQGPPREFDAEKFVQRIMSFDSDGDGKISKQEAPERFKRRFDNLDADGDGLITRKELREGADRRHRHGRDRQRG